MQQAVRVTVRETEVRRYEKGSSRRREIIQLIWKTPDLYFNKGISEDGGHQDQ